MILTKYIVNLFMKRLKSSLAVVLSVEYLFAKYIVLYITIFLIG